MQDEVQTDAPQDTSAGSTRRRQQHRQAGAFGAVMFNTYCSAGVSELTPHAVHIGRVFNVMKELADVGTGTGIDNENGGAASTYFF